MPFTRQHSGPASNFPRRSDWWSFERLFELNTAEMRASGDTPSDIAHIRTAILECAKLGVEERVLLCIIMQESSGNVGVQGTTNADEHGTNGLMQADGSPGFPGQHGLSQEQITSMVRAGTLHFKANLREFGDADDETTIYKALRAYNSGQVDEEDLSRGVGTPSYVSDLARRLCGELPY